MKEILEEIRIFVFGKEKTLTKTIINWGFILLLIAGFTEYGIDHNGDMSGLLKKETWETKPVESIEHPNDTIYIRSVGNVKMSKLKEASKIISNKFGVVTKITDGIELTEDFKYDNYDKVNPYYSVEKLDNGTNLKTVNITTEYMTHDDGITSVMGICRGKTILVSTHSPFEGTLIHEFGHSLGAEHCSDSHCVMSTFADGYEVRFGTNFCQNCKNTIGL